MLFTKDNILDDETEEKHNYNFRVITATGKFYLLLALTERFFLEQGFERTVPNRDNLVNIEIYWFEDKQMTGTKLGLMTVLKGYS